MILYNWMPWSKAKKLSPECQQELLGSRLKKLIYLATRCRESLDSLKADLRVDTVEQLLSRCSYYPDVPPAASDKNVTPPELSVLAIKAEWFKIIAEAKEQATPSQLADVGAMINEQLTLISELIEAKQAELENVHRHSLETAFKQIRS